MSNLREGKNYVEQRREQQKKIRTDKRQEIQTKQRNEIRLIDRKSTRLNSSHVF